MRRNVVLAWFPGLQSDPCFKVFDPDPVYPNARYNCFAYAFGRLDRRWTLLEEAAQVSVALDRADGTIAGVPHYSVIEARAHELGQQLSREIRPRQMGELVTGRMATARAQNAEPIASSTSRDAR